MFEQAFALLCCRAEAELSTRVGRSSAVAQPTRLTSAVGSEA